MKKHKPETVRVLPSAPTFARLIVSKSKPVQPGMRIYANKDGTVRVLRRSPKDKSKPLGVIIAVEPRQPQMPLVILY